MFKYRDVFPGLVLVGGLIYAYLLEETQAVWLSLLILGLANLIRIWARRFVGEHTRLKVIEVSVLVSTGPFRISRNPLYISNMLVMLSWLLFVGIPFSVSFLLSFISFGLYALVIREEENELQKLFTQDFLNYKTSVPRWLSFDFLKRLSSSLKDQSSQSFGQAIRSDAWTWIWQGLAFLIYGLIAYAKGL